MSGARFIVGDVFDVMRSLPDGSVDLILTSPPIEPFLALRSYLPADHPEKAKEIGSEATPGEFIDTLLALTEEWRRLLAPHGSICVELGDTYAGSGGGGGDYLPGGMREGQQQFAGSAASMRESNAAHWRQKNAWRKVESREHRPEREGTAADGGSRIIPSNGGDGWPLDKSLCGIPTLYAWSLAYGRNLLTGEPSLAGQWRIRNLKPWIRSNPPVGALGDKERPATSYITVATIARDRYFDLDAVRHPTFDPLASREVGQASASRGISGGDSGKPAKERQTHNAAGAPPLDWWHHVDGILDAALIQYANGNTNARGAKSTGRQGSTGKHAALGRGGNWSTLDSEEIGAADATGPRGVHLRRALERAGILVTIDAFDVVATGYPGQHYAVYPPELVRPLIDEMCPHQVCRTCGQPSRRITEVEYEPHGIKRDEPKSVRGMGVQNGEHAQAMAHGRATRVVTDSAWTDCGHGDYRRGIVLDPFAGSGTTLMVATGMGRDAIGIDIDERNADLARERCGMFLTVESAREGIA